MALRAQRYRISVPGPIDREHNVRSRSARTLRADGGWRRSLCRSPLRMKEHHLAPRSCHYLCYRLLVAHQAVSDPFFSAATSDLWRLERSQTFPSPFHRTSWEKRAAVLHEPVVPTSRKRTLRTTCSPARNVRRTPPSRAGTRTGWCRTEACNARRTRPAGSSDR